MLDDVLKSGLSVAFCGTAASARSAELGCYYAGRGNKFWPTLAEVGLTPRRLAPDEFKLLPEYGIGLTDIVKGQSGSDSAISFAASGPALVRAKVLEFQPRFLCFNGKRAAQELLGLRSVDFGERLERVGVTRLFVVPSTSGAASGSWDIAWWHEIARLVRDRSA